MIANFTTVVISALHPRLLLWRFLIASEVTNLISRIVVAEALRLADDRRFPDLLRLRALLLLPPWRRTVVARWWNGMSARGGYWP
jgi:hypothetical protein